MRRPRQKTGLDSDRRQYHQPTAATAAKAAATRMPKIEWKLVISWPLRPSSKVAQAGDRTPAVLDSYLPALFFLILGLVVGGTFGVLNLLIGPKRPGRSK